MTPADRYARAVQAAAAEGLLLNRSPVAPAERPWPVVLLTALGAWLVAVPLCGFVGMALSDLLRVHGVPYLVGGLVLAAAVVVLRSRHIGLFIEQLAAPALGIGGGLVAFGLYDGLPERAATVVLTALVLAVAAAVPRTWVRMVLGALAGALAALVFVMPGTRFDSPLDLTPLVTLHVLMGIWLGVVVWQRSARAERAAVVEPLASGWLVAVLAGFAALSGMTFLVGGVLHWPGAGPGSAPSHPVPGAAVSVVLALLGAALLWRGWPGVRRPAPVLAALVLCALAGWMPTLGAVLLAAAVCTATGRWRLAAAAGVAAAWIAGTFYQSLAWPLTTKALVLVAAGLVLGAVAWWLRPRQAAAAPVVESRWNGAPVLLLVGVAACLVAANVGIWQKESVLARGRTVYVELAGLDPRSLMQGDYLQLNFRLPVTDAPAGPADMPPHVVMQVDARGVARPLRIELAGEEAPVLASGELRVELRPKAGRWVLVTDAWHFPEGGGARLAAARYGEFRITPDGDALLVGLRDGTLAPITSP